jgi:hypothetical protein
MLASLGQELWQWIKWGSPILREFIPYGATLGWIWTLWKLARDRRVVTITAVSEDGQRRKVIGRIPARSVTRSEVLGLAGLAAGGARLETYLFEFDENFKRGLEIKLPAQSFDMLK